MGPSDEAFAMLSKASQRMNIKLRDLAERIAAGERPVLSSAAPAARRTPPSTGRRRSDAEER